MSAGSPTRPEVDVRRPRCKLRTRTPWVASSHPFCSSDVLEAIGGHLGREDAASLDQIKSTIQPTQVYPTLGKSRLHCNILVRDVLRNQAEDLRDELLAQCHC
jgi:hypothetical protein